MTSPTSKRSSDVIDLTADAPPKRRRIKFDHASRLSPSEIRSLVLKTLALYPRCQVLLETYRPSTLDELDYDAQVKLLNSVASAKPDIAELVLGVLGGEIEKDDTFKEEIDDVITCISDYCNDSYCMDDEMVMLPVIEIMQQITTTAKKSYSSVTTVENAFKAQCTILKCIRDYGIEFWDDAEYTGDMDSTVGELWDDAMNDESRLSLATTADKIIELLGKDAHLFKASLKRFRKEEEEEEEEEEEKEDVVEDDSDEEPGQYWFR